MKKVVVFGTGQYWKNRSMLVKQVCHIVAFLDNNPNKWNKQYDSLKIYAPEQALNLKYDLILIMACAEVEIKNQLLEVGVPEEKIWNYSMLKKKLLTNEFVYWGKRQYEVFDYVIVCNYLGYDGASMAAIYAAMTLQKKDEKVLICAETVNDKLLVELLEKDVEILISPMQSSVLGSEIKKYINQSKAVLVNTLPMVFIACQICKNKPVLWWIHEAIEEYRNEILEHISDEHIQLIKRMNVAMVSDIARINFEKFFSNIESQYLTYGIPNRNVQGQRKKTSGKITFAIIGSITPNKSQDVFVDAISLLSKQERQKSRFLIIGKSTNQSYSKKVFAMAEKIPEIEVLGELSRKEMHDIYKDIDAVICASKQDCMPIVITEALMYRKICIVSTTTGTSKYIKDGKNGFVFKVDQAHDLKNKMSLVIANPKRVLVMGEQGYEIYFNYFSMSLFSDKLEEAFNVAEKKWYDS